MCSREVKWKWEYQGQGVEAYYDISRVIREGLSKKITLDQRPKGNSSRYMKEDCFKQNKEDIRPKVGICTFENKIKRPVWVEQIERWEDW